MGFRTIVKKMIPTSVFQAIEPTGHLVEAMIMNTKYGFPGRKLKVIGVTGTNGKTTTSFMIHTMLHNAGIKSALITTVGYGIGDDIVHQKQHITSPKASVLQQRLKQFAEAGVEWVVLETSSHGLAQHRVWGVPYQIAVMTNITHDHLEYHGTFENYLKAKTTLFKIAGKHGLKYGVANAEDPNADAFLQYVENKTTYGISKGDIHAKNVKLKADGTTYTAVVEDDSYDIKVQIPGEFNVSNSLAAIAVGRKLGLSKQQIEQGIAALKTVEGRMNLIDAGQNFKVIVDFASTPEGLKFSGQGDALACGNYLFCGKGYRSDEEAQIFAANELGYQRIQLQTIPQRNEQGDPVVNVVSGWADSFFYDIDLALSIIKTPSENEKGLIAYCPEAFTDESRRILAEFNEVDKIEISLYEAQHAFACNLVSTGETVVMSAHAPLLTDALRQHGLQVITPEVSELAKGGGYIRCTSLSIQ